MVEEKQFGRMFEDLVKVNSKHPALYKVIEENCLSCGEV